MGLLKSNVFGNSNGIGEFMRVVAVLGSPRPSGNSRLLSQLLCQELGRRSAIVKSYPLNEMRFKGCQGCAACKGKSDRCVVKDDLEEVLDEVISSDVIIASSPVYWGDVTGQMKQFIDRTYSFLKPGFMDRVDMHRLPPGKRLVWIQTQGAGLEQYGDVFDRYNRFFGQLGFFEKTFTLRGGGLNEQGAALNRSDLLLEVNRIADHLKGSV